MSAKTLYVVSVCLMLSSVWLFVDLRNSGGVICIDYFAFGEPEFPSTSEWITVLKEEEHQIRDGERSVDFLNRSFAGGWRKCFDRFVLGFEEWNYSRLMETEPWLLGGSMVDTKRVAGKVGWEAATHTIESKLHQYSEEKARSLVTYLNPRLWVFLCLSISAVFLLPIAVHRSCKKLFKVPDDDAAGK